MSIAELETALTNWPVLAQAVAGAALFWFLQHFGQKLMTVLVSCVSRLSAPRQRNYLKNRILRLEAKLHADNIARSTHSASILWYRASRDLLKGLIWLSLGLAFSSLFGIFACVGYLGALYHFFFALEVVKAVPGSDDECQRELAIVIAKYEKFNDE